MKKLVIVFCVMNSLFLIIVNCKKEVASNDEQPICEEKPHLENLWDKCEIPYYINTNFPANSDSKIQAAFNAWTEHIGITFTPTQQPIQSNISFIFREFTEEEYEEFRKNNRCGNGDAGAPYALSKFIPNSPVPNPNAEIHFNSKINWDNYDPSKGEPANFQATATHEIGHILGLKHINNSNALMYCCAEGQTSLHAVDIAAIESILDVNCDCDPSSYPNAVKWKIEDGGNGHYYEAVLVGTHITWEEASVAATARGGNWHLATITSASENDFVESLFDGNPDFFNCCHYPVPVGRIAYGPWLGATSTSNSSNDWRWVTGEEFIYADWGPLEPFGNGDRLAYCQFGTSQQVAWNDMPSVYSLMPQSYILECSSNGN